MPSKGKAKRSGPANAGEIKKFFDGELEAHEHNSAAVAAIKTLLKFISDDVATFTELRENMMQIIKVLREIQPTSVIATATDIFISYTTLKCSHFEKISEARADLKIRGETFLKYVSGCTQKVSSSSQRFVSDNSVVMVHSVSRAVFYTLLAAKKNNKRFSVFVTRSAPDNSGEKMYKWLKDEGIPCYLILDAAVGYYMEKVDLVLVGATSVTHNGGILNKVGTYPMALAAKAVNKPFYVVVESYKFSRNHPLSQAETRVPFAHELVQDMPTGELWSRVDYTPPQYINLLLTDLGPLATAAVSDVLMQLYL